MPERDVAPTTAASGTPLTVVGDIAAVRYDERGLVPVVVIDDADGTLLMLAYADAEALAHTLATSHAHFHSRSRGTLWRKGATSGHVQHVVAVTLDCDRDAVSYRVRQTGPACHTGERSCFHEPVAVAGEPAVGDVHIGSVMTLLESVIAERLSTLPQGSYVRRLHERGVGYVAQKVIEEAGETVVAALEGKDADLKSETADLLFHLGVLLAELGVSWAEVGAVLLDRHRERREPRT